MIWAGAMSNEWRNDLLPLKKGRMQAPNRNHKEKYLFPYIRWKTLYTGKLMENGWEWHVAEKILGSLDLALADPTAEINFTISQSVGTWGWHAYVHMISDIAIANIASAITYWGRRSEGLKQLRWAKWNGMEWYNLNRRMGGVDRMAEGCDRYIASAGKMGCGPLYNFNRDIEKGLRYMKMRVFAIRPIF